MIVSHPQENLVGAKFIGWVKNTEPIFPARLEPGSEDFLASFASLGVLNKDPAAWQKKIKSDYEFGEATIWLTWYLCIIYLRESYKISKKQIL